MKTIIKGMYSAFISIALISIVLAGWTSYTFVFQSSKSSEISQIPMIREKMVDIQRTIGNSNDCILEGRDIGTVVFPNAEYKFFLIADLETRAKRRYKDMKNSGEECLFNEVLNSIKIRDEMDSNRECSPLTRAKDAIVIDTGKLKIDEQINKIVEIVNK